VRRSIQTSAAMLLMAAASCGQTGLKFETASVKASKALNAMITRYGNFPVVADVQVRGTHVATASSLLGLIATAYQVEIWQVSGEAWMSARLYSITATMPAGVTKDHVREMLQTLLAERFHLELKRQTKELPAYWLVVGKGGPKLTETPPNTRLSPTPFPYGVGDRTAMTRGGKPGAWRIYSVLHGIPIFDGERVGMPELAKIVGNYVDLPVVDHTGLTATYDFEAFPVPGGPNYKRGSLAPSGRGAPVVTEEAPSPGMGEASDPVGVSIFQSLKHVGLALEKRKAAMEYLVVAKADKEPTEN
jgi:uncharacterized protein (TIGR03435 family)